MLVFIFYLVLFVLAVKSLYWKRSDEECLKIDEIYSSKCFILAFFKLNPVVSWMLLLIPFVRYPLIYIKLSSDNPFGYDNFSRATIFFIVILFYHLSLFCCIYTSYSIKNILSKPHSDRSVSRCIFYLLLVAFIVYFALLMLAVSRKIAFLNTTSNIFFVIVLIGAILPIAWTIVYNIYKILSPKKPESLQSDKSAEYSKATQPEFPPRAPTRLNNMSEDEYKDFLKKQYGKNLKGNDVARKNITLFYKLILGVVLIFAALFCYLGIYMKVSLNSSQYFDMLQNDQKLFNPSGNYYTLKDGRYIPDIPTFFASDSYKNATDKIDEARKYLGEVAAVCYEMHAGNLNIISKNYNKVADVVWDDLKKYDTSWDFDIPTLKEIFKSTEYKALEKHKKVETLGRYLLDLRIKLHQLEPDFEKAEEAWNDTSKRAWESLDKNNNSSALDFYTNLRQGTKDIIVFIVLPVALFLLAYILILRIPNLDKCKRFLLKHKLILIILLGFISIAFLYQICFRYTYNMDKSYPRKIDNLTGKVYNYNTTKGEWEEAIYSK